MTTRRAVLGGLAALPFAGSLVRPPAARANGIATRPIPATGEHLPVIGMGTWITFNVGADQGLRDARSEVLQAFFDAGGGMIDSSPMYGSAEAVIGHGLERTGQSPSLFSATKVWTWGQSDGVEQMAESRRLWGIERFDLLQIHNLLAWEDHLETLRAMKAEGRVRYIGITTSHGRRHGDFEAIMRAEDIDFVQLTYNVVDREAERRLLPLAAERGLAVIVNPAVPPRRPVRPLCRQPLAGLGGGDRLRQLGPGLPEVHRLPPSGHLRHSRDFAGRPHGGEHGRAARPPAGRRAAHPHGCGYRSALGPRAGAGL